MIKFNELLECNKNLKNSQDNKKILENKKKNLVPWVDKYRPTKLSEVIYQDDVIKMLNKVLETGNMPHLLFFGPSGVGKCLYPETAVVMFDGIIKLAKQIKPYDLLMGDDNTSRKVLSVIKGKDMMYKIIQGKGDDYIVNSHHIISLKLSSAFRKKWLEKERRYKLIWFERHQLKQLSCTVRKKNRRINKNNFKTKESAYSFICNFKKMLIDKNIANKKGDICDINVMDYIKKQYDWKESYKGFKCNRITCWEKKNVDLDPYLLGYWLGDGSKNQAQITTDDFEIVDYFKEKSKDYNLNWKQLKNTEKYKGEMHYNMTTGNCIDNKWEDNNNSKNYFYQALKKYDLLNNKHVPDDYKINDVETRLQLIAGFMDADGSLNESNNFEFSQKEDGHTRLFNDIVFIGRSLGFIVSIGKKKKIKGKFYHRANLYGNGIEEIPTKICRKISKEYGHYKDPNIYEIKIQKLEYGNYCGFEIDGNKRFLLGDFTVTHNTSSILSIAAELFGPKKFNERVIELNASDERGINIVRNKIVTLAKTAISSSDPNYPCPPYKIIILDEADAMTNEAQSALRKTMEDNSDITRFCFICNYINQIIDPIISRCVKFRFKSINEESMSDKLKIISNKENMIITDDAIKMISVVSNGDMRKGIMLLQNLNYFNKKIDIIDVYEASNMIPVDKINNIINICINKSLDKKLCKIIKIANDFIKSGYPMNNILSQLTDQIIDSEEITDNAKSVICLHISNTEKRLIDGSDEYLQLLSILMCIKSVINDIDSVYSKN